MTSLCCDVLTVLRGKTLVTAESLTGGGIGAAVTAISGSSAVYKGGIISYTNEVKENILGVPAAVLEEFGPVSLPVAKAMAEGARRLMKADAAVSVTGLAGPGGDDYGNPVGTVCIGYCDEITSLSRKYHFTGDREAVRNQTIEAALQLVLQQNLLCKIPSMEELTANWDREIREAVAAGDSRENWEVWKARSLDHYRNGRILPYFGSLRGRVVTQAVAHVMSEGVQNSEGLVDGKTAYLSAFRTAEDCRGQGCFSQLFRYMLADLKARGYEAVTLGVEPEETENLAIYSHYGFAERVKTSVETYPDGTVIQVDYYRKEL